MPIVLIKKASGETKAAARVSSAPTDLDPVDVPSGEPQLAADEFPHRCVPAACEWLIGRLETMPAYELDLKVDVEIAMQLGFGSIAARDAFMQRNVIVGEWFKLTPWFSRPDVGEWLLPANATWEIHRVMTDDGPTGWATLTIGAETVDAKAKTPWGAFAICILKARMVDLFVPQKPS